MSTNKVSTSELVSVSPADPSDEVGRFPVADEACIDAAVARARRAFPGWRDAGFEARAGVLRRFRDLARDAAPQLARLIAREVGKAIWEAKAEAALLSPKVDGTLVEGMKLVAPIEAAPNARATFHPRGVLAVIGPFNFPAHLPNGHIVPALATGNSVVFKPSEIAPAVGAQMAELWRRAGLPDGVFQVVQGAKETGRALSIHPDIDAILFTGSYAVGRSLREATLDQPSKLLALEMGGNNAMVVLADADLDLAATEAALSICATTGQRCSCAGRLFVARSILNEFQDKLIRVLLELRIGAPLEDTTFMGPLASRDAFAHVMARRNASAEAGGERVLHIEPNLPPPYLGPGLVRFESCEQSHPYQREEIFGPEASLYPIDDLDQAICAVNDSDYGLVASVITKNRGHFDHCVGRIRTGLLNWNKATVGASGKLPFGGSGRSGNDRPAGITSTIYCTVPQSHLEGPAEFDPAALPPGMNRP